ncbi:MAG: endonuclease, partial [Spirosoma sp.]|nr:endonuclease [Spirosoma sp.]
MWDFPHLQVFVLTVSGLAAWFALGHSWQWPLVLLPVGLITAILYQVWLIVPYTWLHTKEVPSRKNLVNQSATNPNTIRLLSANVYQENTKMPDVLRLIKKHQPDLVLLLETNETWKQAMQPVEATYPHQILCPLENMYGLLFYSRFPMLSHELRFLVQ